MFVKVPSYCNPLDIISSAISHGADFIFLDLQDTNLDINDTKKNIYDVPVFIMDLNISKDFF